ncbi:putative membrane protein [Nocardiopsis arvandica]|uniref:Putative membrane protein n=1 Tax=Nocardiopsis sinuspersici TaxID=501010 RepID=A0A7Z0BKA8_9ACTN|nr:putative membrane protein [Nocardiopsis sinuspersici]
MDISKDMRRAKAQYMRRKAQRRNPRMAIVTATTLFLVLLALIPDSVFLDTEVDFGAILSSD